MSEDLRFGLELMFAGMGIVYLFLTMLVIIINTMSNLVQRYFPETPVQTVHLVKPKPQIDKNVAAAITLAVNQHRNKHKG